ncbi:DUF4157 domain-containing protein [Spirulina sp. CS-785/01]|uniref:eCIS core domain-containing protein n=1 Tax=Spirulina sp. CS-785/01 TaxID=3021716 RepID=UPI00232DF900|nr:DUF4157 domain-containing protein [Spirulina sp. CS-785/01]MDB9311966.1 DUF4157 domain-containing protein [Spirulina sp. CS-785/01]
MKSPKISRSAQSQKPTKTERFSPSPLLQSKKETSQTDSSKDAAKDAALPDWQPSAEHWQANQITDLYGMGATPPVQAKLTIGEVGDQYEQEADRVAKGVVEQINTPVADSNSTVQRETMEEDELQMKPTLQGKDALGGGTASPELEQSINQAKGGGHPLDAGLQEHMGQAMRADFSEVKVHTDSQADQLNQSIQAKAFTSGSDIFFKQGEYQPQNKAGQELIAHELTHTLQQGSTPTIQRKENNLQLLDKKIVGSQWWGTSNTEDIQNCIQDYNNISSSDVNYDTQLKILEKLLGYVDKWLSKNSTKKPQKLAAIQQVRTEAVAERDKVTKARKAAATQAIDQKDQDIQNNQTPTQATTKFAELTNVELDNIYNPIEKMIQVQVLDKLGVGRGEWRRSKELNQFRQTLKDAAREQASQDIEEELTSQGTTGAMAEYHKMMANVEAYSTAKGSVNSVMEQYAKTITAKFVNKGNYKKELNTIASRKVNQMAIGLISTDPDLSNPKNLKTLEKAKIAVAQRRAVVLSKQHLEDAIAAARDLTKGNQTKEALNPNKQQSVISQTKGQVTTDEIGKKAVNAVIKADTLTQGFDKIAGLIDANAPSAGTAVSLTIELRIKDPNTGGYFISQLIGEAAKEQEENEPLEVSLRSEFSLGGGWERFGLDLNAQVGYFFESAASDSKKAVGLVSYGLYRNLQTQNLDSTAANAIWGYGGKSQLKDKGEEAETWATAMEEYLFTTDDGQGGKQIDDSSKVEVGKLAKGKVSANLGFATGELEGKVSTAKQYSAESIGANVGKKKAKGSQELADAGAGKRVTYLEFNGAMEALQEFAGGEAAAKIGWDGTTWQSLDIEAAGMLSSALGKGGGDYGEVMNHVCKAIAGYVTALAAFGKKAYNASKAKTKTEAGGEIAGMLGDLAMMAPTIGDQVGAEWGSKVIGVAGDEVAQDMIKSTATEASMNPLLDIKQQLKVGGSLSWEKGGGAKPKVNVYVSQVKAVAADTGSLLGEVFRLKIEGETTNKLVSKTF